ncbi:DUF4153 domain-containing protein [Glycomyces paridis]|uniref:DUF4173 domain-containing protein n=1 Tax=Glycomyces paridis TaxID=2126555 RepID=A0A4S8PG55_9ACTN|nr:DUF4173 domain-containing protein [Glycomyces paridis]THV27274.1 DUF4173 domain-containing protein [Glycomyces paridis]
MSDPNESPAPRSEDAEGPEAPGEAPNRSAAAPEPPPAPRPPEADSAPQAPPATQEAPAPQAPPAAQAAPVPRPEQAPQAADRPATPAAPPRPAAPPHAVPPPRTAYEQQLATQAYYQQMAPRLIEPNPRWHRPDSAASSTASVLVIALALFGAWAAFGVDGVGIGLALTGIGLVAVPLLTSDRRDLLPRLPGAVLVAALWSVAAFRDAGWVVALCSLAAFALTPAVLAPQRRFSGNLVVLFMGWLEGLSPSFSWLARGRRDRDGERSRTMRGLWTALVTVALLLVFGGLFAAADSTFAGLVGSLLPDLNPVEIVLRLMLAVALFPLVLIWTYTAVAKPRFDGEGGKEHRTVSRFELAVPLGALNLLFAAFIAVQLRVYLGGEDYVLDTAGLTFAEYARKGFWQLSVVAFLALGVIALAAWLAPKREQGDRWLVRALLGPLGLMSMVVVASALYRMYTYFETYGLTRMRVWIFTVEIWLAVLFALVLVCCWKLRATWLPRAILASGALALLGLAAVNPDALIARYNLDHDHELDLVYLAGLSDDAVPEFEELSAADRACVVAPSRSEDRAVLTWNLGYQRAEEFREEHDQSLRWEECPTRFGY